MNRPTRVYSLAGSSAQRSALERIVAASDRLQNLGSGNLSSPVPRHADVILAEVLPGETLQQELYGPPYWVALLDEARSAWIQQSWLRGLRALLPRRSEDREIEAALEAVGQGLIVQHPDFLEERKAEPEPSPLSAREHEVLTLLALGKPNRQIAEHMSISEHTVKFHLASIFQKLKASTRSQAVATGIRRGYVSA